MVQKETIIVKLALALLIIGLGISPVIDGKVITITDFAEISCALVLVIIQFYEILAVFDDIKDDKDGKDKTPEDYDNELQDYKKRISKMLK